MRWREVQSGSVPRNSIIGECHDKRNSHRSDRTGAVGRRRHYRFGSGFPVRDAGGIGRSGVAEPEVGMIARILHGAVPAAKNEDYLHRMRKVALPGSFLIEMESKVLHYAAFND